MHFKATFFMPQEHNFQFGSLIKFFFSHDPHGQLVALAISYLKSRSNALNMATLQRPSVLITAVAPDRVGPGSTGARKATGPADPITFDLCRFPLHDWLIVFSTLGMWTWANATLSNQWVGGGTQRSSVKVFSFRGGGGTERGGCSIRRGRAATLATTTEPKQGDRQQLREIF